MVCEPRLSQLFLAVLSKLMKVRVANDSSGRWIENSIRYSVSEAGGSIAGGELVMACLSELLFMETLRLYTNRLLTEQTGLLAGTRDPVVGKALALLHREVATGWALRCCNHRKKASQKLRM